MAAVLGNHHLPASVHVCRNESELRTAVLDCDIVITRGIVLAIYPFITELGVPLVVDMYCPSLLEGIQREADADRLAQLTSYENELQALRLQLLAGDFFVCADERQRDYWLGMLSAFGRINPYTHHQDPALRRLIDVVPFGLPRTDPQHTKAVLKGVYKTIAADDKVILWGGGIWNWLDAPTLIRAMPSVLQHRPDVKLFFMGVKRPNPNVAKMKAVDEAITLSRDLDLFDVHVFFNDWVAYAQRQNYLLEADIGASLHLDHIETRFAFRTRLLDYVWAGLPVLATGGDVLSEMLASEKLARVVAPRDIEGVAQAILALLSNPTLRADSAAGFQRVAARYHWDTVTGPLQAYCAAPYSAPDKKYLAQGVSWAKQQGSVGDLMSKSVRALRLGGLRGFLQQTREYLRWKARK
jgi:glycosyltransferase involved in cell wall biosynthesis